MEQIGRSKINSLRLELISGGLNNTIYLKAARFEVVMLEAISGANLL